MRHTIVRDGIVAGILGASAVALWFLVLDLIFRHALATPEALGRGLLRILGRHDYLAVDSWIRKKFRSLHRGPARATDGAIARRYARYGRYKGLALWLEMTGDWHEPITPSLRS